MGTRGTLWATDFNAALPPALGKNARKRKLNAQAKGIKDNIKAAATIISPIGSVLAQANAAICTPAQRIARRDSASTVLNRKC